MNIKAKNKLTSICKHCGMGFTPIYDYNNGIIKSKKCPSCLRIERNKKLLAQSTMFTHNYSKTSKYSRKNGQNRDKKAKTAQERFNSSRAWYYFSRFVLAYYSPDGEIVTCATCNKPLLLKSKKSHCGHLIRVFEGTKTHYSVSLEFINTGPQCSVCNTYMGGRQDIMREWLENKHGKEEISKLYIKKNNICHADITFFDYWGSYWKGKFHQLLIDRNFKNPWK